ncbi:hypothetical protein, partial [Pseudomonas sp. N8]|uniref:hypothetical protein n=1 Tax=Pseudomonas sp. N8 TaxID=3449428 RepID=UPI003F6971ED
IKSAGADLAAGTLTLVAWGFIPGGRRSTPQKQQPGYVCLWGLTLVGCAEQPSGDKSPRHKV